VLIALLLGRARGAAAAELVLGPPRLGPDGQVELLLAPVRTDGGRARLERVQISVDGRELPARVHALVSPTGTASGALTAASAGAPSTPLAVGLVYFWGEGAPQEILDGVPRLLRPLPAATPVHPVPYGEGLPAFVMPRTAADLRGGDLDLVAPIAGRRSVLARAVEFGARELLKDRAALPFLFVVTDGLDHEQRDPLAFFQLGRALKRQGLLVTVVTFPATDPSGSENAAQLAAGAEGRHLLAPSRAELGAYLEGAGLGFLDVAVATVRPGRRLSGGEVRLEVRALVEGAVVAGAAPLRLPGWPGLWVGAGGITLALGLLVVFRPRRAAALEEITTETAGSGDDDSIEAVDDSRGLGLRPPADTPGERSSRRVSPDAGDRPGGAMADGLAGGLAALVGQPIEGAVVALRGRLGDQSLRTLAAWSFAETAAFLRWAEPQHAGLATRPGRQWVLALQDALVRDGATPAVGWLVRASGPGIVGETLLLADSHRLGPAATIVARGHGFVLVEGDSQRPLCDGETLAVGSARYVFKSVA
jgi:hypothetical protein